MEFTPIEGVEPVARLARATGRGFNQALGALDISIYRNDFDALQEEMRLRGSHIDFDVRGRQIILVDDVLFTGRIVRSAMDAIMDRVVRRRVLD